MQVSTSLSVPVPRRGSHRPNPGRGPKYPAAPQQPPLACHLGQGPQHAKDKSVPGNIPVGCCDHHCTPSKPPQASLSRDALCPCCTNGCDKGVAAAPHELHPSTAGTSHSQQQPGCEAARCSSQQNWKQRLKMLHKLGRATMKSSLGNTLVVLHAPSPPK